MSGLGSTATESEIGQNLTVIHDGLIIAGSFNHVSVGFWEQRRQGFSATGHLCWSDVCAFSPKQVHRTPEANCIMLVC